ncbi:MAG: hypothetical protein IIW48_09565, partial [Clostridia bacterium]|nr:hypothetical protein [Clostridia bacterium]
HMISNFIGGFVSVLMLDLIDYNSLMEITEAMKPDVVMAFLKDHAVGLLVFMLYSMVLMSIVVFGVVMFFVNKRKFKLEAGEVTIEKGQRFKTVILNVGMILFCVFWLVMIVLQLFGIYYLVLSLVVNAEVFSFGLIIGGVPVGTVAIALIGIGFVMSFVFSNYEGSIIKSIIASLTNIVSVLLGVVNVFSDIVSYIRLWAVGLAGAAISATVNELAGPLLGNFMFMVFAIILLVFGHGLNMILNILSVIVHGIRLNTLEFSSHLDMSWSGHKFKPFKE